MPSGVRITSILHEQAHDDRRTGQPCGAGLRDSARLGRRRATIHCGWTETGEHAAAARPRTSCVYSARQRSRPSSVAADAFARMIASGLARTGGRGGRGAERTENPVAPKRRVNVARAAAHTLTGHLARRSSAMRGFVSDPGHKADWAAWQRPRGWGLQRDALGAVSKSLGAVSKSLGVCIAP
jgi:hypothetical protein